MSSLWVKPRWSVGYTLNTSPTCCTCYATVKKLGYIGKTPVYGSIPREGGNMNDSEKVSVIKNLIKKYGNKKRRKIQAWRRKKVVEPPHDRKLYRLHEYELSQIDMMLIKEIEKIVFPNP